MDLHEIFSIGPQWANKYEVTLNLTQPHLPLFVMTYHDHSHPIKTSQTQTPQTDLTCPYVPEMAIWTHCVVQPDIMLP